MIYGEIYGSSRGFHLVFSTLCLAVSMALRSIADFVKRPRVFKPFSAYEIGEI